MIYKSPPLKLIVEISVSIKLSTVPVLFVISNLNSSAVILFVSVLVSTIEFAIKLISLSVDNFPKLNISALYLIFDVLASVTAWSPIVIVDASTSIVPVVVMLPLCVNSVSAKTDRLPAFSIAPLSVIAPTPAFINVSAVDDTTALDKISILPVFETRNISASLKR